MRLSLGSEHICELEAVLATDQKNTRASGEFLSIAKETLAALLLELGPRRLLLFDEVQRLTETRACAKRYAQVAAWIRKQVEAAPPHPVEKLGPSGA